MQPDELQGTNTLPRPSIKKLRRLIEEGRALIQFGPWSSSAKMPLSHWLSDVVTQSPLIGPFKFGYTSVYWSV
jgi:hypothetical protein